MCKSSIWLNLFCLHVYWMSSQVMNVEWKSKNFWQKSNWNQSEWNQSERNQSERNQIEWNQSEWNQSERNQSEQNQSEQNQNFLKSPRAPWSDFFFTQTDCICPQAMKRHLFQRGTSGIITAKAFEWKLERVYCTVFCKNFKLFQDGPLCSYFQTLSENWILFFFTCVFVLSLSCCLLCLVCKACCVLLCFCRFTRTFPKSRGLLFLGFLGKYACTKSPVFVPCFCKHDDGVWMHTAVVRKHNNLSIFRNDIFEGSSACFPISHCHGVSIAMRNTQWEWWRKCSPVQREITFESARVFSAATVRRCTANWVFFGLSLKMASLDKSCTCVPLVVVSVFVPDKYHGVVSTKSSRCWSTESVLSFILRNFPEAIEPRNAEEINSHKNETLVSLRTLNKTTHFRSKNFKPVWSTTLRTAGVLDLFAPRCSLCSESETSGAPSLESVVGVGKCLRVKVPFSVWAKTAHHSGLK